MPADTENHWDKPAFHLEIKIGDSRIDEEHQELLLHLKHIAGNPQAFNDFETFAKALTQIGFELQKHFDSEELLLRNSRMPKDELEKHLKAHEEILEQFIELNLEITEHKETLVPTALRKIESWIIGHMLSFDSRIQGYI